jgi:hypothetical protein
MAWWLVQTVRAMGISGIQCANAARTAGGLVSSEKKMKPVTVRLKGARKAKLGREEAKLSGEIGLSSPGQREKRELTDDCGGHTVEKDPEIVKRARIWIAAHPRKIPPGIIEERFF